MLVSFRTTATLACVAVVVSQFLPPLKQKILIPSYWSPCYNPNDPPHGEMSCNWDQIVSDTASHAYSAIGNVILNPDSGPGSACDAGWLNVSQRVRQADVNMGILGYSHTSYGNRSLADVQAEIDRYFTCYPPPLLTGVFLDEASGDCAQLPYYQALYTYIRAKSPNTTIVLNPGWASSECYLAVADVLVTFEGPYQQYTGYTPAPWHVSNNATHFAHIIYNASLDSNEHLAAFRQSKSQNAGHVYITNLTLPNPYATLPQPYIYWDQELRWAVNII